jgi:hypothetical protein
VLTGMGFVGVGVVVDVCSLLAHDWRHPKWKPLANDASGISLIEPCQRNTKRELHVLLSLDGSEFDPACPFFVGDQCKGNSWSLHSTLFTHVRYTDFNMGRGSR